MSPDRRLPALFGVRSLGPVACLVVAAACGGDSQGESDSIFWQGEDDNVLTDDGPVPVERFVQALARAACDAAEVCEPDPYIRKLHDDGDCVEALERYIGVDLTHLVAAVRFGEASYDGAAARACLDSFAGKCPEPFQLVPNSIRPGNWCPEAFGDCRVLPKETWEEPLARGAACLPIIDTCARGLRCSFASSTCEPCADGSDAGAECELRPATVEAFADIYLVDRPEGASCEHPDYRLACNRGLRCVVTTSTCVAPRRSGAPCPTGEECAGRCGGSGCEPACTGR